MLAPNTSVKQKLLSQLREELSDSSYMIYAFSITTNVGPGIRQTKIYIENHILRVDFVGAGGKNISIPLAGSCSSTLSDLVTELKAQLGNYGCVTESHELHTSHPSTDLRIKSPGRDSTGGTAFYHNRWSDDELFRMLDRAVQRHNVGYTVHTVPDNEVGFVVTLAAEAACRSLAQDGVKRRGLSFDVKACIDLAESYAKQYTKDRDRQLRAIPVAQVKNSETGVGDILLGHTYRTRPRFGASMPAELVPDPETPKLINPAEEDVQDTQVRLRWDRVAETPYSAIEIWRDTRPDVRRAGTSDVTYTPNEREGFPTTAVLVYATSAGVYPPGYYQLGTSHYAQNTFVDGQEGIGNAWGTPALAPIEPDTVYYYALYVIGVNGNVSTSNIIEVKTKSIRAQLSRDTSIQAVTPSTGPMAGNTAVTLRGTRFHAGMRVKIGDKEVGSLVVVSSTVATGVSPEVFNPAITGRSLAVTIESTTGLLDMKANAWRYTAS